MKFANENISILFGIMLLFFLVLGISTGVLFFIPGPNVPIALILIVLGILVGIKAKTSIEKGIAAHLEQLKKESMVDPDTGLLSYRYLIQRVTEEIARSERDRTQGFSLVLMDMKGLEDVLKTSFDKEEAARKLKGIAQSVQAHIRGSDTLSFQGGESFVLLMRQQGSERAQLFDRLKSLFENSNTSLNVQAAEKIQIRFRAMDYPGEKDLVQELLQSAKEVV